MITPNEQATPDRIRELEYIARVFIEYATYESHEYWRRECRHCRGRIPIVMDNSIASPKIFPHDMGCIVLQARDLITRIEEEEGHDNNE